MDKIKIELLTKLLKMDDEVTFHEHGIMFQIERNTVAVKNIYNPGKSLVNEPMRITG